MEEGEKAKIIEGNCVIPRTKHHQPNMLKHDMLQQMSLSTSQANKPNIINWDHYHTRAEHQTPTSKTSSVDNKNTKSPQRIDGPEQTELVSEWLNERACVNVRKYEETWSFSKWQNIWKDTQTNKNILQWFVAAELVLFKKFILF